MTAYLRVQPCRQTALAKVTTSSDNKIIINTSGWEPVSSYDDIALVTLHHTKL